VALTLGPLAPAYERVVVQEQLVGATVDSLLPVVDVDALVGARRHVRSTHVAAEVLDYALAVVHGTRTDQRVSLGASTRAALTLVRLAQSLAVLRGGDFVLPDDVKHGAVPCLAHRLVMAGGGTNPADVVRDALTRVGVPVRR
jgi:MoxR-like ATPase